MLSRKEKEEIVSSYNLSAKYSSSLGKELLTSSIKESQPIIPLNQHTF
jgi:hypothetical protein